MTFAPPDGFSGFLYSPGDLPVWVTALRLSGTAFAAMVKAVRQSYECLAQGKWILSWVRAAPTRR